MYTLVQCFSIWLLIQFLDSVCSIALSNDGKYLATASKDKTVNLIDLNSKELVYKFDTK